MPKSAILLWGGRPRPPVLWDGQDAHPTRTRCPSHKKYNLFSLYSLAPLRLGVRKTTNYNSKLTCNEAQLETNNPTFQTATTDTSGYTHIMIRLRVETV
jgi:hypothetical protein